MHRSFKTARMTTGQISKCTEPTVTHTDINHSSDAVCLFCLSNRFNMCWRVEHRNTLKENPVKSEIQQLCDLFHWIYSSGMWSFVPKFCVQVPKCDIFIFCVVLWSLKWCLKICLFINFISNTAVKIDLINFNILN